MAGGAVLIEPVEPGYGAGSFFWCGLSLPSVLVSLILVGLRLICCWSGGGATTTSFVTTLKVGTHCGISTFAGRGGFRAFTSRLLTQFGNDFLTE